MVESILLSREDVLAAIKSHENQSKCKVLPPNKP